MRKKSNESRQSLLDKMCSEKGMNVLFVIFLIIFAIWIFFAGLKLWLAFNGIY